MNGETWVEIPDGRSGRLDLQHSELTALPPVCDQINGSGRVGV